MVGTEEGNGFINERTNGRTDEHTDGQLDDRTVIHGYIDRRSVDWLIDQSVSFSVRSIFWLVAKNIVEKKVGLL